MTGVLLSDRTSLIVLGAISLFASLFGLVCIVRPKFGNLSRAIGVFCIGGGLIYPAAKLGWWRVCMLSVAMVIAPGLIWCAVECFRLQKARVLSRFVGASLAVAGISSEYYSWLFWSHIPMR